MNLKFGLKKNLKLSHKIVKIFQKNSFIIGKEQSTIIQAKNNNMMKINVLTQVKFFICF